MAGLLDEWPFPDRLRIELVDATNEGWICTEEDDMPYTPSPGGSRGPLTQAEMQRLTVLEGQRRLTPDEAGEVRYLQIMKQPTQPERLRIDRLLERAKAQRAADEDRANRKAAQDCAPSREKEDGWPDLFEQSPYGLGR